MLKGLATIELIDKNTGEKKVIEKENLVTNALNELFWSAGFMGYNIDKTAFFPVSQKLLGGLVLWENPIEKDASRIFEPAGNKVVGTGAYGLANNGTNLLRGSYNVDESSVGNNVVKHVWDFTTNQANGKISALSLGPVSVGRDGFGTPYLISSDTSEAMKIVGVVGFPNNVITIDEVTGNAYAVEILSTRQIALVVYETNLRSIPVTASDASAIREIERTTFDLSVTLPHTSGMFKSTVEGNVIHLISMKSGEIADGQTIYVVDIDVVEKTCTVTAWTNKTGNRIYTSGSNGVSWNNNAHIAVHRGYVYVQKTTSPYTLYRAPVNDYTAVETLGDIGEKAFFAYACEGRLYYIGGKNYVIDDVTKEIRYTEFKPVHAVKLMNSANRYLIRTSSNIYTNMNVICTIDNLDAAVTKSETQAMKVIYTITQV